MRQDLLNFKEILNTVRDQNRSMEKNNDFYGKLYDRILMYKDLLSTADNSERETYTKIVHELTYLQGEHRR